MAHQLTVCTATGKPHRSEVVAKRPDLAFSVMLALEPPGVSRQMCIVVAGVCMGSPSG
jgi:hypothetical protein